jgi:hypothetical protein
MPMDSVLRKSGTVNLPSWFVRGSNQSSAGRKEGSERRYLSSVRFKKPSIILKNYTTVHFQNTDCSTVQYSTVQAVSANSFYG